MPRPGPNNIRNRRRSNIDGKSVLTERLEEIVVFELGEDGNREYRTMTLRGLYNYVMKCITNVRPSTQSAIECGGGGTGRGGPGGSSRSVSLQECTSEGETQMSPSIGPRAELTRPTRLRSGSVSVGDSPAVNAFGSSAQSSTRSVRFHPLTPGLRGNDGDQGREGGEGVTNQLENTQVTYRERLGGYLHPRDMR